MYTIVQSPSDILRQSTKPVNLPGPKLQKIIEEMKKTLLACTDPEGIGLAANQVSLPYSLFLARFSTKKSEPVRVFINPEIVDHSTEVQDIEKKHSQLEGCLSIPKYYGAVKRWLWIKLRYQTLSDIGRTPDRKSQSSDKSVNGLSTSVKVFKDFPAIVIQHEMDHLSGKVFIEKILEQKGKLYKITGKDKRGKEIWEQIRL